MTRLRLIIRGESNEPRKKDFTGAFLPESQRFTRRTAGDIVVSFDNTLPMSRRFNQLLNRISLSTPSNRRLDCIGIFCHGWRDGIQAGITRKNVRKFLEELKLHFELSHQLIVVLYCCSTGAEGGPKRSVEAPGSTGEIGDFIAMGEGSFADTMRDELCKMGIRECRVVAHLTAGHTTQNPHVVIFEGAGSALGGFGGFRPISPRNKKLWGTWVKLLKTDFRFDFPLLDLVGIQERVLDAAK